MDREPRRTKTELVYIAAVTVFSFAFAAVVVVGVPALLIVRTLERGATTPVGLIYGTLAVAWIVVLVQGLIRDRETRGWILFLLLFWLPPLAALARRALQWTRR